MLYFVRTTNTCRPTYITILQCELDIHVYIDPLFQHCLEGVGRQLRNTAIFEVPSYFLGTDDDVTSRSSCICFAERYCRGCEMIRSHHTSRNYPFQSKVDSRTERIEIFIMAI